MPKILSFGSMNIDYVYDVDHFVRPGESLSVLSRSVFCGGKGLNQSVAMARAGGEVFHAGVAGQDGGILLETLRDNGVNTDCVRLCEEPSGHAIIQRDRSGDNCILYCGGANQCVERTDIAQAVSRFEAGDFIVLQNEIGRQEDIMGAAKKAGMRIVFNPSPMDARIGDYPLDLVDFFVLNQVEAGELCGETEPDRALRELRRLYPEAGIVLTLGSGGAVYLEKGRGTPLGHGVYKVPVVDTTGAGDTFTGYFVACTASGTAPEETLRLASVAASLAVSRSGAAASIPTMEEVRASRLRPAAKKTR